MRCKGSSKVHSKTYRVLTIFLLFLISLNLVPLPIPIPTSTTSKAWWNSSWQYYRVCNIDTNGYSGYYQMKINVSYSSGGDVSCNGHCQSDFDDIRFVDIDNSTVLPYWKETHVDSQYAIFWVNVSADAMSDGKILMYYGNSEASDASDGDETFIFFDDFESGDESAWDGVHEVKKDTDTGHLVQSTVKYEGSYAWNVYDDNSDGGCSFFLYKSVSQTDYAMQGWFRDSFSSAWRGFGFFIGYNSSGKYYYIRYEYNPSSPPARIKLGYTTGSTSTNLHSASLSSPLTADTWYRFVLEKAGDNYSLTIYDTNGSSVASATFDTSEDNLNLNDEKGLYASGGGAGTGDIYSDVAFIRKYASTEPSWSSFGSEQSQEGWANTPPSLSNENPANESTNVNLQPTLSVDVTDADGNSTNVWLWTSEDGGTTWTLRNSTTFPDGNGTITYNYTEANQYSTTYYWKVSANDSHDNTTKIYHFTTKEEPLSNKTLPYTVDYNNSIDDKILKLYSDGGSGGLSEHPNAFAVYDEENDCFYFFYFVPSNQSDPAHLAVKKYWISNNTFSSEYQFPRSGDDWKHSFPVGESWAGSNKYENHIRASVWLDKYNHIYGVYGGHATSTYPITVFRSTVPITELDYDNISHWERVGNLTKTTGSCYHTELYVSSGYYEGYILTYYREGPSGGRDYFAWSSDNGTTWTRRKISDDAAYSRRGWFYDYEWEKWIFLCIPKRQDWPSHFHFYWATIDDIINGTGLRNSSQSIDDTPAYSFPITKDTIPPGPDNFGIDGSFCIAYYPPSHRVFIPFIDESNGEVKLMYKNLGSSANWTILSIDTVTTDSVMTDADLVYDEGILLLTSFEKEGSEWVWKIRWSNDPTNTSAWHSYNATNSTVPTDYTDLKHPFWPNIQKYNDSQGTKQGEIILIHGPYKRIYSPVLPVGTTIEEAVFTYIDLRETVGCPSLTNPSVSPSSGVADYTIFYFNITYSDPDGDPPTEIKVNISKTGWYLNASMTYISGDNTTGALYSYNTTLSAGTYDYLFYASDGTYSTVNDPIEQVNVEAQSYSFTVSTADPSGQENFTASATMGAEWNVSASYQTSSIPAIQITNTGNVPINISINLTSTPISNVHIKYNTSSTPPSFTQNPYYCDKELTTTPVTALTIEVGGTGDIWLWADFENKTNPGSYTTKLYIASSFGG